MNLGLIRNLCEKRQGGIKKLAQDIGMTAANLHRRLNANDIMASDLEKIAKCLDASVLDFFDEEPKPGTKIVRQSNRYGDNLNESAKKSGDSDKLMSIIKKKDEQIDRLLVIIENMQLQKS